MHLLQHDCADPSQDQHVEEADHHIDLPARKQHSEDERTSHRAQETADDHHPGHLHVDPAAAHVDHRPRHARSGDLSCRRSDGNSGRDPIEDEERRGQEPAADAEHAR